ncbi:MAG: O-antigen ligase family protein [Candidatus Moraniibacteriota bacterium]
MILPFQFFSFNKKTSFIDQGIFWCFLLFLITFPFSIRKILWYIPIQGNFNEYASISLFLSDLFLWPLLFFLFLKLIIEHKNKDKSIFISILQLFHGEQFSAQEKLLFALPIFLSLISLFSSLWSIAPLFSFFAALRFCGYVGFFLFLVFYNVPRETSSHFKFLSFNKDTIFSATLFLFLILGSLEGLIAILQFSIQHSLGLTVLKESILGIDIPGVAKIIFHSERFIRGYGTFPHPNMLGGFLIASILCTGFILFHGKQLTKNFPLSIHLFLWIGLVIQLLGLFASFSKSALIGLLLATVFILYHKKLGIQKQNQTGEVDCSTGNKQSQIKKSNYSFQKTKILITVMFIFIFLSSLLWYFFRGINLFFFFIQSLNERLLYQDIAFQAIHIKPFFGWGMDQFIFFQQAFFPQLLAWQFQPAHTIFLLITTELGLFGSSLFIFWLIQTFSFSIHNVSRETFQEIILLKSLLIGFIFISFFDHYFWTLPQGQILWWTFFGLLIRKLLREKIHLNSRKTIS